MEKLFYEDIHITDFDAAVLECKPDGRGRFLVRLDRTAFFPEQGGQSADKGILDGQSVRDVRISEDIIWHVTEKPVPEGNRVRGQVDWAQRFDFMQQHTGEHILSGLAHSRFGYDNVGFHLSLSEVTLDFNGPLSPEDAEALERAANETVWRNLPVQVSCPSSENLQNLSYRSKLDLTENVRLVEIPGVDVCACCAPHVERTGQIGLIKITGVQSHRGGVRLNILCGGRALEDYRSRQSSVTEISVLLSARQDRVADAVRRLREDSLRQKERANSLQADLLRLMISEISPEEDHVSLFAGELDGIALRNAVNGLTASHPGYCCIFSGNDREGYRYAAGSASLDCRKLAAALKASLGAKGGGSALMVQGSLNAPRTDIEAFMDSWTSSTD